MCDSWTIPLRNIGAISGNGVILLTLFFCSLSSFVLLNLVMGMIVESALKLGNQVDGERMEYMGLQALQHAFKFCGHRATGSGFISLQQGSLWYRT